MPRHFSFAGMQRSGNHAIIEWLCGHFNGHRHRNNIMGLSCKDKAAQFDTDGDYTTHVRVDSWENFEPLKITISNNSEPLVVIVRDPYNWWASWFSFVYKNPNIQFAPLEGVMGSYLAYIEYARSFPDRCVIFNRWFGSRAYRRRLEHRWNLGESDQSLNQVAGLGGGSSFDLNAFHNRAQKMNVLKRYESVMHIPDYIEPLRKYPELADISRELFELEPPENIHV